MNRFSWEQKGVIALQTSVVTLLFPLIFFAILRLVRKADNWMIPDLVQRRYPLVFQGMMFYILMTKSFTLEQIPELFYFLLGATFATTCAFILTFFRFRISLHMIGISGVLAFTIGLALHNDVNLYGIIAFVALANGLVASSRLSLQAHTITEIFVGFTIGAIGQIALYSYWI